MIQIHAFLYRFIDTILINYYSYVIILCIPHDHRNCILAFSMNPQAPPKNLCDFMWLWTSNKLAWILSAVNQPIEGHAGHSSHVRFRTGPPQMRPPMPGLDFVGSREVAWMDKTKLPEKADWLAQASQELRQDWHVLLSLSYSQLGQLASLKRET